MPLADALVRPKLVGAEPRHPLELVVCQGCSLVQILETVPPDIVFGPDDPYHSSCSETLVDQFRHLALELIAQRALDRNSFVVEVGCNDGCLLRHFVDADIPTLGVDPVPGPTAQAERLGVPVRRAVEALRMLLKEDGACVIEVPYVRDLVDLCAFDTIYQEHLCYFSLTALDALFRRHGLFVTDVRRLSIHNGSLRLIVEPKPRVSPSVTRLLEEERHVGLGLPDYYARFAERAAALRSRLIALIARVVRGGPRLAAYGAAAKGTVLLNYTGLDRSVVDHIVDRNVHKHGWIMPGVGIPIDDPACLLRERPDFLLILAWNFKDEIMRQQQAFHAAGGRFIVPVPEPEIV